MGTIPELEHALARVRRDHADLSHTLHLHRQRTAKRTARATAAFSVGSIPTYVRKVAVAILLIHISYRHIAGAYVWQWFERARQRKKHWEWDVAPAEVQVLVGDWYLQADVDNMVLTMTGKDASSERLRRVAREFVSAFLTCQWVKRQNVQHGVAPSSRRVVEEMLKHRANLQDQFVLNVGDSEKHYSEEGKRSLARRWRIAWKAHQRTAH